MKKAKLCDLERYWQSVPVGAENAITYDELCLMWSREKRAVRSILQQLSVYDNKDNYILIRSGKAKGFFRTEDREAINAYRAECLANGKSNLAPLRKIKRVLEDEDMQLNVFNNLKAVRLARGIKQTEVVEYMRQFDSGFDAPALSKLENGAFLPTPYQLRKIADFYGCKPFELVAVDLVTETLFA